MDEMGFLGDTNNRRKKNVALEIFVHTTKPVFCQAAPISLYKNTST
jgi:hypothetical protein